MLDFRADTAFKIIAAEVLKSINNCSGICPNYNYIGRINKSKKKFHIGECNSFIKKTGAKIYHKNVKYGYLESLAEKHDSSAYIVMPRQCFFKGTRGIVNREQRYYMILFHELIHWSGCEYNLDRISLRESSNNHECTDLEEMIAELGSIFLCSHFDVCDTISIGSQYINEYLGRFPIKKRPSVYKKVTKQAIISVQYLLNLYYSE